MNFMDFWKFVDFLMNLSEFYGFLEICGFFNEFK